MKWINNLQPGELSKLMGKEFMEEFKRISAWQHPSGWVVFDVTDQE
jgi:hypothetical protein